MPFDPTSFFEMEDAAQVPDHSLWVERYRPRGLDDFIGSPSVRETLKIWLETKDIPHILFFSSPGTGKTSLGKMLTRLIPCDSLIINASDENKVDDIRNKVQDFCMTMGVNPLKIMFLDECLDENTVVWVLRNGTERGISIKNVNPNSDLVKSFNVDKDRIEWRPFELIFQGQQETYEIEFENGEVVVCTKTHKWYVQTPDGKVIRKKTRDLLADGDTYIMTTEADRITADAQ